jgi:hypothetical protein
LALALLPGMATGQQVGHLLSRIKLLKKLNPQDVRQLALGGKLL